MEGKVSGRRRKRVGEEGGNFFMRKRVGQLLKQMEGVSRVERPEGFRDARECLECIRREDSRFLEGARENTLENIEGEMERSLGHPIAYARCLRAVSYGVEHGYLSGRTGDILRLLRRGVTEKDVETWRVVKKILFYEGALEEVVASFRDSECRTGVSVVVAEYCRRERLRLREALEARVDGEVVAFCYLVNYRGGLQMDYCSAVEDLVCLGGKSVCRVVEDVVEAVATRECKEFVEAVEGVVSRSCNGEWYDKVTSFLISRDLAGITGEKVGRMGASALVEVVLKDPRAIRECGSGAKVKVAEEIVRRGAAVPKEVAEEVEREDVGESAKVLLAMREMGVCLSAAVVGRCRGAIEGLFGTGEYPSQITSLLKKERSDLLEEYFLCSVLRECLPGLDKREVVSLILPVNIGTPALRVVAEGLAGCDGTASLRMARESMCRDVMFRDIKEQEMLVGRMLDGEVSEASTRYLEALLGKRACPFRVQMAAVQSLRRAEAFFRVFEEHEEVILNCLCGSNGGSQRVQRIQEYSNEGVREVSEREMAFFASRFARTQSSFNAQYLKIFERNLGRVREVMMGEEMGGGAEREGELRKKLKELLLDEGLRDISLKVLVDSAQFNRVLSFNMGDVDEEVGVLYCIGSRRNGAWAGTRVDKYPHLAALYRAAFKSTSGGASGGSSGGSLGGVSAARPLPAAAWTEAGCVNKDRDKRRRMEADDQPLDGRYIGTSLVQSVCSSRGTEETARLMELAGRNGGEGEKVLEGVFAEIEKMWKADRERVSRYIEDLVILVHSCTGKTETRTKAGTGGFRDVLKLAERYLKIEDERIEEYYRLIEMVVEESVRQGSSDVDAVLSLTREEKTVALVVKILAREFQQDNDKVPDVLRRLSSLRDGHGSIGKIVVLQVLIEMEEYSWDIAEIESKEEDVQRYSLLLSYKKYVKEGVMDMEKVLSVLFKRAKLDKAGETALKIVEYALVKRGYEFSEEDLEAIKGMFVYDVYHYYRLILYFLQREDVEFKVVQKMVAVLGRTEYKSIREYLITGINMYGLKEKEGTALFVQILNVSRRGAPRERKKVIEGLVRGRVERYAEGGARVTLFVKVCEVIGNEEGGMVEEYLEVLREVVSKGPKELFLRMVGEWRENASLKELVGRIAEVVGGERTEERI